MPENDSFQAQLQAGSDLPSDRKFYFNGYTIAMTPTDIEIVLQLNNKPVATLNTSLTIAKMLAIVIDGFVKDYESKTGQRILTLDELKASLSKRPQ